MKIKLAGVLVDDQKKALAFSTDVVGFERKTDLPVGEFRWLTVASAGGSDEIELLSEPTTSEWGTSAVFNDTCGNLIALFQEE